MIFLVEAVVAFSVGVMLGYSIYVVTHLKTRSRQEQE